MNTLLEDDLPTLESLELSDPADFARRLSTLEEVVSSFTRRVENEVFARIRRIEESLATQALTNRQHFAQETSERQEQIASLAGKISRKIDHIHRTTMSVEKKQVIVNKQVQTKIDDRIEEARRKIAEETCELRAVLQARLDELANGA